MALVTDIVPPDELAGFIRELDPAAYGFTLAERFLPITDVQSNEWEAYRSDRTRQPIAGYRSWDTEAQIASRPGTAKVRGEIPPISLKLPVGEEMRIQIEKLRGFDASLADQIYDDAAFLTEAILGRVEKAIGEALFMAEVTFDADAGYLATLKVDYGATTTITGPGVMWSTIATSTPITDLVAMVAEYAAANGGRPPDRILTSTKVRTLILQSTQVKSFLTNQGVAPALATVAQLGDLLQAYNLPPIEVYDTLVNVAGSATRVTPLNDLALLPNIDKVRFGETQNGITADALELAGSGFLTADTAPGLVGVVEKIFDPASHWTKVSGVRLPVIKDPKMIGRVTVSV